MNKFENEYRQLMQNETPDLWSRIEAGIDAKIAAGAEVQSLTETKTILETDKKKKQFSWKKYSLPLVACIAALLFVPLMLTGFLRMAGGGRKWAETENAAADCAAPEEMISTTSDEAEMPAEEYLYFSENADEAVCDGASVEMAETESAPMEDAMITGEAVLTVTEILSEADALEGTIYNLFTIEEGECSVFVPLELSMVMDLSGETKILVSPGNGEYDYILVSSVE